MPKPFLTAAQQTFLTTFDDQHDALRDIATAAFAWRNAVAPGGMQSKNDTRAALIAILNATGN